MAIAAGTLTVNAAFLQEIKEDNHRLRELLQESAELFNGAALHEPPVRKIVEMLSELRDQLALHFSLEEAYGYFEDALEVAPQLSEQAQQLRSQHGALFVELCRMVEQAEQWLYEETSGDVWTALRKKFGRFQHHLREHESQETAIIMDAFGNDVGVGD